MGNILTYSSYFAGLLVRVYLSEDLNKKNASDRELMIVSRLTVIIVAIIAVVMSTNPNNTVLSLVENA